jgi:uncharacterized protein YbjT (DUF2867 family)
MRIFLTGASGFIGQHLIRALLTSHHQIIACVRSPEQWRNRFPQIEWMYGDFTTDHTPEIWKPRLQQIDVIINAVGIIQEQSTQTFQALHTNAPMALFKAGEQLGICKIIQISALGATAQATSRYYQSKYAADQYLKTLDIDPIILYPSIVLGQGGGSAQLFAALAALPMIPLVEKGQQILQPIDIKDICQCILNILNEWKGEAFELVGSQRLSLKELLIEYRHWLGFSPTFCVYIPLFLMGFFIKIARWFHIPLNQETLNMLLEGNYGDQSALQRILQRPPHDIKTTLQLLSITTAERWQARLFFLRPVLRLSIALVWIVTGLVSSGLYPVEQSYVLLAATGISSMIAPFALYGAALIDFGLGIATLFVYRLKWVITFQMLLILSYTVIISFYLPDLWLHPFGAVTKNIPLLVATLILLILEEK